MTATDPVAWGEAHTSPELDVSALRSELDACKAEIERLRLQHLDDGALVAALTVERDEALEFLGPRGLAIVNMAERASHRERTIVVARRVAQHWRTRFMGWPGLATPSEALSSVIAALDGEERVDELGIVPGPDRDVIESMAIA